MKLESEAFPINFRLYQSYGLLGSWGKRCEPWMDFSQVSEEGRFVIYEEHKEISVLDILVGPNSQSCYLECVCVCV